MKISVQETDEAVVLKIEGRTAKPLVDELDRTWQKLARSLGSRTLSIDLRGVTFMDMAGRNLLAEIHAKTGAKFLADTPMTKYFADEATRGSRPNA